MKQALKTRLLDARTDLLAACRVGLQCPARVVRWGRSGSGRGVKRVGVRRYALVGARAMAGVRTPPDLLGQILLAVPLCVLYEVAISGIWFTERSRARADAAPEAGA